MHQVSRVRDGIPLIMCMLCFNSLFPTPLATDPSSYTIQAEHHYKKLPRGSSPSIFDRALPPYQRDPGEAQPTIGNAGAALGPTFP